MPPIRKPERTKKRSRADQPIATERWRYARNEPAGYSPSWETEWKTRIITRTNPRKPTSSMRRCLGKETDMRLVHVNRSRKRRSRKAADYGIMERIGAPGRIPRAGKSLFAAD